MQVEVVATPVAQRQIAGLRGQRRQAFGEFEQLLAASGCAAMGYRLTGDQPLASLCIKHLRGADRVVVAFVEDQAWVLLVGPHAQGERAADVYAQLYDILGLPRPEGERSKPPCCGENAKPPALKEADVDAFLSTR